MKTSSKLIIVLGIAAAFAVSLAVGVPFATLLLVGAVLLCPAMMFFGMGMMQHGGHGCGHCGEHAHNQSGKSATVQSEARRAA